MCFKRLRILLWFLDMNHWPLDIMVMMASCLVICVRIYPLSISWLRRRMNLKGCLMKLKIRILVCLILIKVRCMRELMDLLLVREIKLDVELCLWMGACLIKEELIILIIASKLQSFFLGMVNFYRESSFNFKVWKFSQLFHAKVNYVILNL